MMSQITEIINNYTQSHGKYLQIMELFFKSFPLEMAIEYASFGWDIDRKMNRHQHRVGEDNCRIAFKKLDIQAIAQAITFEEIFVQTEKVRLSTLTHRIGDLWSYDTALRIGFNLNIYPTTVYLQTGAKKGASHLINRKLKRSEPIEAFPTEFHSLKPHQIENLLCVCKGCLSKLQSNPSLPFSDDCKCQ